MHFCLLTIEHYIVLRFFASKQILLVLLSYIYQYMYSLNHLPLKFLHHNFSHPHNAFEGFVNLFV